MDIQFKKLGFIHKDKYDLSYFDVSSVKWTFADEGKKVLFVSDNLCRNAIKEGCVLTEYGRKVWSNLLKMVAHYSGCLKECLVVPFNQASTKGMSDGARADFYAACEDHIIQVIKKYKPDIVVFMDTITTKFHLDIGQFMVKDGITYIKSISLSYLTDRVKFEPNLAYCCGYVIQQVVVHLKEVKFEYPEPKQIFVDTTKKLQKFFDALNESETPCIDTETVNLYKVANRLLSIQVMTDKDHVWFIPYKHKDSPFNSKQLKMINEGFKNWCERGKSKFVIFHNAKFDLEQIKAITNYQFFSHDIWDTIAGLFCFSLDTKIETNKGVLSILDIVKSKENILVKSYNIKGNKVEYKPIINKVIVPNNKNMMEIDFETDKLKITEDHKVWCVNKNKYIEAQNIEVGDEVLIDEG